MDLRIYFYGFVSKPNWWYCFCIILNFLSTNTVNINIVYMKTFRNFDSREKFVRSLDLWHYDPDSNSKNFFSISNFSGFESELKNIHNNIDIVKSSWNDQSINQIEESVLKQQKLHLDVMQGQKNDKLNAGYDPVQPMYRIKVCPQDSVFYQIANNIGLEHSCARYHVQFPGEVTVFHTDIFSPAHEFLPASVCNPSEETIGQDLGIRRVLIALEDWNWGHVMMFGSSPWMQWKSGDLVYWEYGVPHCSANMGYTPRVSVSITGLATDKFYQTIKDNGK
jgi:hypothetical protein